MASCVTFDNDGVLRQSLQSTDECLGYILISPLEHSLMVQTVDINPTEIVAVFSLAFIAVVTLSALAFKVDVIKNLVRMS